MKAILITILFAVPLLTFVEAYAQGELAAAAADGSYAVVATLGAGFTRYIVPYDAGVDIERSGASVSARLLWHPDHRLRIGVESGWTRFYSYDLKAVETSFGTTDASLSLSAIPLVAVFSMSLGGSVALYAGAGGYFVRSHASSFGTTVDVTRFSQGWMAAISWDHQVTDALRIGAELKWYGATEFGDGILTVQLCVPITLLRW